MLIRKMSDHVVKQTPTCGKIREVLQGDDYKGLDFAFGLDMKPTTGHYHKTFDEIYIILDGSFEIRFHDPKENRSWTEKFESNELVVIERGIHHRIISTSPKNRLGVICVPGFKVGDEHLSNIV
ncbi:MAG: hypothetical protein AB4050_12350 [Synechococcus sp.]